MLLKRLGKRKPLKHRRVENAFPQNQTPMISLSGNQNRHFFQNHRQNKCRCFGRSYGQFNHFSKWRDFCPVIRRRTLRRYGYFLFQIALAVALQLRFVAVFTKCCSDCCAVNQPIPQYTGIVKCLANNECCQKKCSEPAHQSQRYCRSLRKSQQGSFLSLLNIIQGKSPTSHG